LPESSLLVTCCFRNKIGSLNRPHRLLGHQLRSAGTDSVQHAIGVLAFALWVRNRVLPGSQGFRVACCLHRFKGVVPTSCRPEMLRRRNVCMPKPGCKWPRLPRPAGRHAAEGRDRPEGSHHPARRETPRLSYREPTREARQRARRSAEEAAKSWVTAHPENWRASAPVFPHAIAFTSVRPVDRKWRFFQLG
jgi:hypothetical protein